MRYYYRSVTIWAAMLWLVGCGGVGGDLVSPRLMQPTANYTCSNALVPPGSFRMVYSPDGKQIDTSGSYTNRFLEPHRSKDTVWTTSSIGPIGFLFGPHDDSSHVCVSLSDSLSHHAPNVSQLLVP